MTENDKQHVPGRTSSCCISMANALRCGYIRMGYFYRKHDPPSWIPWSLDLAGEGWREVSPIHFCPFCGVDLDAPER